MSESVEINELRDRGGADDYLVKPLSAASLREAVASTLRRKKGYYHAIKESISVGG